MLSNVWKRLNGIIIWNDVGFFSVLPIALAMLFVFLTVSFLLTALGCDEEITCCEGATWCGENFDYSVCPNYGSGNDTTVAAPPTVLVFPPTVVTNEDVDVNVDVDTTVEAPEPTTCPVTTTPTCEDTCLTPYGRCIAECVKNTSNKHYRYCVKRCRRSHS